MYLGNIRIFRVLHRFCELKLANLRIKFSIAYFWKTIDMPPCISSDLDGILATVLQNTALTKQLEPLPIIQSILSNYQPSHYYLYKVMEAVINYSFIEY